MNFKFKIFHDVDTWRRKVVVELWPVDGGGVPFGTMPIDRCRIMGGFPFPEPVSLLLWLTFPWRLKRRKETMVKRAVIMLAASTPVSL